MICPICKKDIMPKKSFKWWGWLIVILGLSLWAIPSVIYIIYFLLKTPKECPVCGYENIYQA